METTSLYILKHSGEKSQPDGQKFEVENLNSALDSLLSQSQADNAIILYVHGRGAGKEKEPDKSLKDVMPCLEQEYPAKVLMFYWQGSDEGGALGSVK